MRVRSDCEHEGWLATAVGAAGISRQRFMRHQRRRHRRAMWRSSPGRGRGQADPLFSRRPTITASMFITMTNGAGAACDSGLAPGHSHRAEARIQSISRYGRLGTKQMSEESVKLVLSHYVATCGYNDSMIVRAVLSVMETDVRFYMSLKASCCLTGGAPPSRRNVH